MIKYLIAAITIIVSCNVSAQEVCTPEEKPHYFMATGTAKNGTSALKTFGVVSPAHKDLTSCNAALEFLFVQTGIAGVPGKIPAQLVHYEGFCLAVEFCP